MPHFEMPADAAQERQANGRVERSLSGDVPGAVEPSPDRARRALRWTAVLAGGACIGALLATHAWVDSQRVNDARAAQEVSDIVDAHLAAVEVGDYRAAAAMSDLDPVRADPRFVDAGLQPHARPDIACQAPDVGALTATVRCEIVVAVDELPPERASGRLLLERVDDQWALVDGLAVEVRLFPSLQRVESVGGATLPPSLQHGARPFWLFPGVYSAITSVPEQLGGTDDAVPFVVTSEGGRAQYGTGPSPAVLDDAIAAAIAAVEACSTEGSSDCPERFDLQPGVPLEVESVETMSNLDDPFAFSSVVAVLAPRAGSSIALVDVRIDFGADLDRYEITTSVRAP